MVHNSIICRHIVTEDINLKREWEGKKEESTKSGDHQAKWIRRRGIVVNVGTSRVQTPRKATVSATGGRRPVTVTGKYVDLQQSTCTSTCLRVLYSNVDSVLNKRAELSVYLQLHKRFSPFMCTSLCPSDLCAGM